MKNSNSIKSLVLVLLSIANLTVSCTKTEKFSISLNLENDEAQVQYGAAKLKDFASENNMTIVNSGATLNIETKIDSVGLESEAYNIKKSDNGISVAGGDANGLLYGLLHIKEELANGNHNIKEKEAAPHLDFRAIKFNLPWDAYRGSKTLAQHTETCRDTVFWTGFLDMMAENRFNKLTLWNLHPFNYMVKLEKYPEANTFTDEEMEEWQRFWHTLFKMAKDRGIETYLVNWNIFVPQTFSDYHNVSKFGKDEENHIGDGDTSALIKDYMRESVRETIDAYPDLTGLGITLGERMGGMTAEEREEWLLETVVEGARQAKRKIKFIHRVPLSAGKHPGGSTSVSVEQMTRKTLDTLTVFDGPMNIELKFNWSHAFSTPKLVTLSF